MNRMRCLQRSGPRAQRGIALILALWITVLLTVVASGFAFSMRSEALATRNALSLAQARATADGAVERMAYELGRPQLADTWRADGSAHTWQDGAATIVASAVDEAARVDINYASDALMKSLLLAQGVDDTRAAQLVDAIADWRDTDDLKRPNGAEDADYRAAGLKYGPANGPFEAVADLGRVLGMTSDLYTRLARLVTVYSRQQGVNPQTASRDVLLALPNATPEAVDLFISQRAAALAARQPVPAFPPAQGFASGAVPVWRIHAEATMPDGVTFVREAVLRPSADPRRPLIALAWLEAPRAPPQAPAAAQDSSTAMAAPVAATSTAPGGAMRSGSLMKSYGR